MSDLLDLLDRLRCYGNDTGVPEFARSTMREANQRIAEETAQWALARDENCTLRAKLAAAEARAERLSGAFEWIQRQDLDDLTIQLVVDAEHDGQYYVCGDSSKPGYGPTLLDAVESAALAEGEAG